MQNYQENVRYLTIFLLQDRSNLNYSRIMVKIIHVSADLIINL